MKWNAVVFDFNGTLVFDTKLHNQAWDVFLARHEKPLSDQEKNILIHGKNNQQIMRQLFPLQPEQAFGALILEKETIYQNLCLAQQLSLAPGAEAFLDFLSRKNIPRAIATASGKENVDFYFEHFHLARWFDESRVIFNNGRVASKPDPEIFNLAMAALKAQKERTVIFEDSLAGIQAAVACKAAKVFIVNSGMENYERFDLEVIGHYDEVDRSLFE